MVKFIETDWRGKKRERKKERRAGGKEDGREYQVSKYQNMEEQEEKKCRFLYFYSQ